ncbi:MAG: hypothetical protein B0D92_05330 [Spirochaeta sp. LUC14_002_19_P3]|nr:MAG: hypothetical protein B0D92_05330 [Spirochaeta sp. LUC14_002_19_P3]
MKVSFRYTPLVLSTLIVSVFSCGAPAGDDKVELVLAMEDVESIKTGLEKILADHSKNFKALTNLAAIELMQDELPQAAEHLNRALSVMKRRSDLETVYLLRVTESELALKQKRHEAAKKAAEAALQVNPSDPLHSRLYLSRALYALRTHGNSEAALKAYQDSWENDKAIFLHADFEAYADLLAEAENWDAALTVSYEYFKRFGYRFGMGAYLSTLHEKAGNFPYSVLAAYLDLRYGLAIGAASLQQVADNLKAVEQTLRDNNADEGIPYLKALQDMEKGRWAAAYTALIGENIENPIHAYLGLAAAIESGQAGQEVLAPMLLLEDYYSAYPEYYYRIAHEYARYPLKYGFAEQRPVLEKVIFLAPGSAMAAESRRVLCRLSGIDERFAADIYLLGEQAAAVRQYAETGRTETLAPLVRLLDFKPNPYTQAAEKALSDLSDIPPVRTYLTQVKNKTPLRNERITYILN